MLLHEIFMFLHACVVKSLDNSLMSVFELLFCFMQSGPYPFLNGLGPLFQGSYPGLGIQVLPVALIMEQSQ
eukprot:1101138-Prorocentrum_lima.AAC.1